MAHSFNLGALVFSAALPVFPSRPTLTICSSCSRACVWTPCFTGQENKQEGVIFTARSIKLLWRAALWQDNGPSWRCETARNQDWSRKLWEWPQVTPQGAWVGPINRQAPLSVNHVEVCQSRLGLRLSPARCKNCEMLLITLVYNGAVIAH